MAGDDTPSTSAWPWPWDALPTAHDGGSKHHSREAARHSELSQRRIMEHDCQIHPPAVTGEAPAELDACSLPPNSGTVGRLRTVWIPIQQVQRKVWSDLAHVNRCDRELPSWLTQLQWQAPKPTQRLGALVPKLLAGNGKFHVRETPYEFAYGNSALHPSKLIA